MSWLDDEAKELRDTETKGRHERELIVRSNYWAQIISCLKDEVDAINKHPDWSKKAPFGVKCIQPVTSQGWSEGWQVNYSGVTSALVEIANRSDHIEVARRFQDNSLYKDFRNSERLRVATQGDTVVLVTDGKQPITLMIPEAVVQYLLKGIIESLKREP